MDSLARFMTPYSAAWVPWVIVGLLVLLISTVISRRVLLREILRAVYEVFVLSLCLCAICSLDATDTTFSACTFGVGSGLIGIVYVATTSLLFLINNIFLRLHHFEEVVFEYNTIRVIAASGLLAILIGAINGLSLFTVRCLAGIAVVIYWVVIWGWIIRKSGISALHILYSLLYITTLEIIPLAGIILWYKRF